MTKKSNKKQNKRPRKTQALVLKQNVQRVPRPVPLPLQTRVRLRFVDVYLLSSTGGIAAYAYSGNAASAPDAVSGSDQPYYYDRYSALYQDYVVLGSTIKIKAAADTGSNQCVMVGLAPYYKNTFPATTAGMREILEAPYSQARMQVNAPVRAQNYSLTMTS